MSVPQRTLSNKMNKQQQIAQLVLDNHDHYNGQWKNKMFDGQGQYVFYQKNLKYVGQFQQGKQHGWGVLLNINNNKAIYEGEWRHGVKHGQGKYNYPKNGCYYHGTWENNFKSGKGIFNDLDGLYNGQWTDNQRNGNGSLKMKDGTEFKGIFKRDQFISGTIKYLNGDCFEGEVKNCIRNGFGKYYCAENGEKYDGLWRNGDKNGGGVISYANGDEIMGTFQRGKLNEDGQCTYRWNNGAVFKGHFKNGFPFQGKIIQPDGEKYQIKG